jgi:polyferredoxin
MTAALVVVALALTVLVPVLLRRRVLCPVSVLLGLAAGLAWAAVAVVT